SPSSMAAPPALVRARAARCSWPHPTRDTSCRAASSPRRFLSPSARPSPPAPAGVFWETTHPPPLFKLPVIFVCEDNGYAVDTPREARQMSKTLCDAVKPFGADPYEDESGDG